MTGYVVVVFPLVMTVVTVLSISGVAICEQEEQVGTLRSQDVLWL